MHNLQYVILHSQHWHRLRVASGVSEKNDHTLQGLWLKCDLQLV